MAVNLDSIQTWTQYGNCRKAANFRQPRGSKFSTVNNNLNKKISLYLGDISQLKVDAVVTSTNNSLMQTSAVTQGAWGRQHGTVDGAVHAAAGPGLQQECGRLANRDTGDVVITNGHQLPARYVIHAIGPVGQKANLLFNSYEASLQLVKDYHLRTVAFPCIATGLNGYPVEDATRVALQTIRAWLEKDGNAAVVDRIVMCIYLDKDLPVYENLLHTFFPLAPFKENAADEEEEYDMSLAPCGYVGRAVIFNIVHYRVDSRPTRAGSEKDAERIKATFSRFGFEVDEQKDKTKEEILNYFRDTVELIDPQHRCFVCFFLAHGLDGDFIVDVNNEPVSVDDLTNMIDGKRCPKMATKPKLFFAQMCRGVDPDEYEENPDLYDHAILKTSQMKLETLSLPPELDKMVAFSTSRGRMSRRDHQEGSEYINALCDVLDSHGSTWKLDRVMREVRTRISRLDPTNNQYFLCPEDKTNTLTKSLQFQVHRP